METPRTHAKKFSNRSQKVGESVETFASDLKNVLMTRLTRAGLRKQGKKLDLLRQFFDGLDELHNRGEIEFS